MKKRKVSLSLGTSALDVNDFGVHRFVTCMACCIAAASTLASQASDRRVERLYIEAFAAKTGAEELQQDLRAELRKVSSISLVTNESAADLVLGGGGEIWIRGYRSLNPRSGRLPSDGAPVYGGYLSVELKNKDGVTLWSYLVTPTADAENVSKDLAKKIAKHLPEGLEQIDAPPASRSPVQPSVTLSGAGATFPYPVYSKWFINYQRENPSVRITYDAVGSEAGVRRLLSGGVDFAGSDSPDAIRELAPPADGNYLFFPSVVGAVVPIVNLPGVPNQIAFTPEALAGIFLGSITKWNDPALRDANRGVRLPDLDVVVVHRSDGSGTSYAWTDYLSKISPAWKAQVDSSLSPKWPAGRGATGNDGVAKLVKELGGSIGYVEFIYALENHLAYGRVRNRHGEFVEAGLESIAAAAGHSGEVRDDFMISLTDAPGEGAYPITSFTWLVFPAHIPDEVKRSAIGAFLRWMIGPGQRQAAALGYLALPREIIAKEEGAIGRIH